MTDRPRDGFPPRILLSDGTVVDADPLLPTAAAFLDGMPLTELVSPDELAAGIYIDAARAERILAQLEALGHAGPLGAGGEAPIFNPDGPTDPTPLERS